MKNKKTYKKAEVENLLNELADIYEYKALLDMYNETSAGPYPLRHKTQEYIDKIESFDYDIWLAQKLT